MLMYHVSIRSITDYFDFPDVYWVADALFMAIIGLFMYSKSEDTKRNLIAVAGIIALASCQALNRVLILIDDKLEIRHVDVLFTILLIVDFAYLYRIEMLNGVKRLLKKIKLIKK